MIGYFHIKIKYYCEVSTINKEILIFKKNHYIFQVTAQKKSISITMEFNIY